MPSTNSEAGTWKFNPKRSTFTRIAAFKSATSEFQALGAGRKTTVDTVQADGSTTHWEYTANYDGKDTPVTGNPNADMVALTRLNPMTTQTIWKKDGEVGTTMTLVVSDDEKTLTTTGKGAIAGQPVDTVTLGQAVSRPRHWESAQRAPLATFGSERPIRRIQQSPFVTLLGVFCELPA